MKMLLLTCLMPLCAVILRHQVCGQSVPSKPGKPYVYWGADWNTELVVSWNYTDVADNFTVTTQVAGNSSAVQPVTVDYPSLNHTFTGLVPGEGYTFRVTVNSVGKSGVPSVSSDLARTCPSPPGKPNVQAGADDTTELVVLWNYTDVADFFEIFCRLQESSQLHPNVVVDYSSLSHTFIGLVPGQSYSFDVNSHSGSCSNVLSDYSDLATTVPSKPGKPNVQAGADDTTELVVSWNYTDVADNFTVTTQVAGNSSAVQPVTVDYPSLSHTFTGLVPGEGYTFRVTANSGGKTGLASELSDLTRTVDPSPKFCHEAKAVHPLGANVTFPQTLVGFSNSTEEKCPSDTASDGKPYGTRACLSDASWDQPVWISSCNTSLKSLSQTPINDSQREQVASDVVTLTSELETLQPEDIQQAAEILTQVTNTSSLTTTTSSFVVESVGNLLSVSQENLTSSGSAQSLLTTLDDVIRNVNLTNTTESLTNVTKFQSVTSTVAVAVVELTDKVGNIGFETSQLPDDQFGFRSDQFAIFEGDLISNAIAQIIIPFEAIAQSERRRTGFFSFVDDKLFQSLNKTRKSSHNDPNKLLDDAKVNSPMIISATVVSNTTIQGLSEVVNITFKNLLSSGNTIITTNNTFCSFWNESGNFWSTEGCNTTVASDNVAQCQCNHLTNFAALFSLGDVGEDDTILDIITIVGSSISALCCLLTVLCILWFWRKNKLPLQTRTFFLLVCLSFALLLLNIFLLLSQLDSIKESEGACQIIALLIHFALLSSLAWMMVEAIYMNIAVTQPIYFRFHLKSTTIYVTSVAWGWGALIIFVTIVTICDCSIYKRSKNTCWMNTDWILYLIIIPAGVILSVNLISYIVVLWVVIKRKQPSHQTKSKRKSIMVSLSLFVIFGITWIFGFLLFDSEAYNEVFAYIFTIFNSLQGFFVFLLFTVRNKSIQDGIAHRIRKLLSGGIFSCTTTSASTSNQSIGAMDFDWESPRTSPVAPIQE